MKRDRPDDDDTTNAASGEMAPPAFAELAFHVPLSIEPVEDPGPGALG